CIQALKFPWTF
nr:immunoglobulin light chain junction region [Macaca mulatta]